MLLSEINLAYYQELMAGMRAAIGAGRFADFRARDARGLGARAIFRRWVKRLRSPAAPPSRRFVLRLRPAHENPSTRLSPDMTRMPPNYNGDMRRTREASRWRSA